MTTLYNGREKYVVFQHVQNSQSVGPLETSVADPDPRTGAFLTPDPGSGMDKYQRSRSGIGSWMNILDHISESLETFFWVRGSGSGIRNLVDPGWDGKIWIRDKHLGSAILL